MVPTALIGGTGLLESDRFRHAPRRQVTTPFGPVTLLEAGEWLFLQRHGLEGYTPPHRIDHRANLSALHQAGARRILALGSVGSLRRELGPGRFVLPDDFLAPWANPTLFDDLRGHQAPAFHPTWRQELLTAWERAGLPPLVAGGVYLQTTGPRFETPAEIRLFAPHAHVVGMTVASECILAGELGLPYAALCLVDNLANGLAVEPLSYEGFKAQVRANQATLLSSLDALMRLLEGEPAGA